MSKILLVDDDVDILSINKMYLQKEGFEVTTTTTAKECLEVLTHQHVDCIILDVMLPGLNGFDACRFIKSVTSAPVIFLTGRTLEAEKLKGLSLGANDYITKPYSLKELLARIKVQLRLVKQLSSTKTLLSYPPLTLNLSLHKVFCFENEIILTNREFELLALLLKNINQVVTFEMIGESMWGTYSESDRKTIVVIASRLRKKFQNILELEYRIETIWSKGYKYSYRLE